ncbi:MAG: exodeoxyribonuclease I [Gammaproteobacteria bacterium]
MTNFSYFWHDYETFGTDPQRDRACQFAGIRTDLEFNIIGDPLVLYCKTPDDYLPNPEACLITGISPQLASEKGVCEAAFIACLHEEFARPGTCSLGYNTIRFDDEVTRNLLYRNFFDPYAREWQNGNTRWDMIDVVRATRALRPDGIQWPVNEEGVSSFRLEELTHLNGISHQSAHDALSDVYATIALARLIRDKQPKLYDYFFANRHKSAAIKQLQLGSYTPLVHVSGRFPARNQCLAIVLPICAHPRNRNEVIAYDLSIDPRPLLEFDAEAIRERLFVSNADLPEGGERIPLKTIHLNKSPVLAPVSVVRPHDAERLQLDLPKCLSHLKRIQAVATNDLETKLAKVFTRHYDESTDDPDLMIYSGGFFSDKDKAAMQKIRQTSPDKLITIDLGFDDERLAEMLFRYRARNFPATLSPNESKIWHEFCRNRLTDKTAHGNLYQFYESLKAIQNRYGDANPIISALRQYADQKRDYLSITI